MNSNNSNMQASWPKVKRSFTPRVARIADAIIDHRLERRPIFIRLIGDERIPMLLATTPISSLPTAKQQSGAKV
jgi:hypothetical protein